MCYSKFISDHGNSVMKVLTLQPKPTKPTRLCDLPYHIIDKIFSFVGDTVECQCVRSSCRRRFLRPVGLGGMPLCHAPCFMQYARMPLEKRYPLGFWIQCSACFNLELGYSKAENPDMNMFQRYVLMRRLKHDYLVDFEAGTECCDWYRQEHFKLQLLLNKKAPNKQRKQTKKSTVCSGRARA